MSTKGSRPASGPYCRPRMRGWRPAALDRPRFMLRLACNKKLEPANWRAERVMKWTF